MGHAFGLYWKYDIILITSVLSCITIIFALLFIYRICQYSGSFTKMHTIIVMLTVTGVISCTVSSIGDTIHISHALLSNIQILSQKLTIYLAISDIFLFVGNIAFYALLITRVQVAFSDSVHKLNKCFLFILWLLVAIICIGNCAYILLLVFYLNFYHINTFDYNGFIASVIIFIEFILDIVLSIIFIYKLCQVFVSIDAMIDHYSFSRSKISRSKNSIAFIMRSKTAPHIVNTITRHCILFTIAISANMIVFVAFVFIVFNKTFTLSHKSYMVIPYIARQLEDLCMVIVLFLNLNVNHSIYNKICKICHVGCLNCCVKWSYKRHLRRQNKMKVSGHAMLNTQRDMSRSINYTKTKTKTKKKTNTDSSSILK
eukprot:175459_1